VADLITKVLPHFREYPLISSKQSDVMLFERICRLIHEGQHLRREGFEAIVRTAMEMNPSGKRKYSADDILGSSGSGERIVCAASNRGST